MRSDEGGGNASSVREGDVCEAGAGEQDVPGAGCVRDAAAEACGARASGRREADEKGRVISTVTGHVTTLRVQRGISRWLDRSGGGAGVGFQCRRGVCRRAGGEGACG